jgi:hypothetical protein
MKAFFDRMLCANEMFLFSFVPVYYFKLETQSAEPESLTFHSTLRKLNTEPSIGASHEVLVHLAKRLQRRRLFEINQSETRMVPSVTAWPNESKFGRKHPWKVFSSHPLINMAATGHSCFWLVDFEQSSSL